MFFWPLNACLRSKTFFMLQKNKCIEENNTHLSGNNKRQKERVNISSWIYSELNLKSMQEFELRVIKWGRQTGKARKFFTRTVCLLSLRVAFFEVASWLRKYSHTGVEINHACHPHAASLRCPAVGYLLWCVMAAVRSCLSSASGLFQWLFPLHSKHS